MEMKFLIAVCFIFNAYFVIVKAESKADELKKFQVLCERVTGVNSKLVDDGKKGTLSDDPKFKSFLVCLAKKIGFVKENGEIQHEVFKSKVGEWFGNQEKSNELYAACAVKEATVEDTIFETMKCYREKSGRPIILT